MTSSIRFVSSKSHCSTITANRAAHAKGATCDLPTKNEFQGGVIGTVHFKIASRLFQIYQAMQDERYGPGIKRERTAVVV
jgi:hypothetical protein